MSCSGRGSGAVASCPNRPPSCAIRSPPTDWGSPGARSWAPSPTRCSVEPVRAPGGGTGDAGGFLAGLGLVAAMEVDGLRPYRQGTPGTRIHWSSLARGAGLMERRLRPETDERPLLVLDGRVADPHDGPQALDATVRAAASLTRALARQSGVAVLLPGDR